MTKFRDLQSSVYNEIVWKMKLSILAYCFLFATAISTNIHQDQQMTANPLSIDPQLLEHWNQALSVLSAQEILLWSLQTFPGLYQTTAFGLTGLCILDMLSKIIKEQHSPVDLVFIDTLYHFPQTYDLVNKVRETYPQFDLNVYKPEGCQTEAEFVSKFGDNLWETDELKYDYLVKVEPLKRAYEELQIKAVFTGRRSTQGKSRSALPIIEYDDAMKVVKINPLAGWSFDDVKKYIDDNHVPCNELLSLGYKSVGDWHSTQPVADGEDERDGRWKGRPKTECGIHVAGMYAEFMQKQYSEQCSE